MSAIILQVLLLQLIFFPVIAQEDRDERAYLRAGVNLFTTWSGNQDPFVMGTFNIAPGFQLIKGRDVSATITLPLSAGGAFREIGNSYFGMDVPAMLEFHFGSATGENRRSKLGLMLGGGAGYILTAIEDEYTGRTRSIDFWGLRFHTGISFGKLGSAGKGMVIASFGKSFTGNTKYTLGLGLAVILTGEAKDP
jgi:hypothetical protein